MLKTKQELRRKKINQPNNRSNLDLDLKVHMNSIQMFYTAFSYITSNYRALDAKKRKKTTNQQLLSTPISCNAQHSHLNYMTFFSILH